MIDQGADVNEVISYGDSPLHLAVRYGYEDIVGELILSGADLTQRDDLGLTAFYWALVSRPNTNVVAKFLEAGVDVNGTDGMLSKMTPLSTAAMTGDTELIKMLLAVGADANTRDKGNQPLHWAVNHGNIELVKLLIEANANVNAIGHAGETPLHIAIRKNGKNASEIVNHLLMAGATLDTTNELGYSPFQLAVVYGRKSIARELMMNHHLKDLDEMSPIEKAIVVDSLCGENTLEAVIWDNVNFVNQDRLFLPITVASVLGNSHAVRLLIQAGAEVNRSDRFGNSPSYYATVRDDKETIELLLSAGANIEHRRSDGETLLETALIWNSHNAIRELAKAGANLNQEYDGESILHTAVKFNSTEVVRALIESGADISRTDSSGNTPLHHAIRLSLRSEDDLCYLVDMLLPTGSESINFGNSQGNTPLHEAAARGNKCVVEKLLLAGADVTHENRDGATALQTAIKNGHMETALVLVEAELRNNSQ